MTNIENESQGSKAKSPVIDLEAEDISSAGDTGETDAPKEEQEETVSPPPPPQRPSFWTSGRIAAAAAIIAVFLGAWAYREFGSRLWPPSAMTAMEEKLAGLEASNRTLNEQLVALSGTFDTFRSEATRSADELAKKAAGLDERLTGVEGSLSELRQSVASLSASTGGTSDPAALADVTQRIEQLEQAVAALRDNTTPPPTGNADYAQLSQALSDLKAKFQAGLPYKEELDRISVYVPQNADVADLAPYAAAGLANAQALGTALETLVPTLSGPTADGSASGEASGFWAWVGTVVKIRDLNTLDWADLARSAAADAKAGDLTSAIARLEEPGGELPQPLAEWRDKARQRLKAEVALAQLADRVTRIIMGKP